MRRRRVMLFAVLVAGLWGAAEAAAPAEVDDPVSPASSPAAPACPAEQTGPADVDAAAGGTVVWFVLVPPGCEVPD